MNNITAWKRVEIARSPNRKTSLDYIDYIFDENKYELVGEMTGKRYKLGQTVEVTVAGTDELMRTIDFELEDGAC